MVRVKKIRIFWADKLIPRGDRFTEADKASMWDRWQKGDSVHSIARLSSAIHAM